MIAVLAGSDEFGEIFRSQTTTTTEERTDPQMLTIIDAAEEALVKAYHRGQERGGLATSPRTGAEWSDPARPRPVARSKSRAPRLTATQADAEVEHYLLECVMEGAL